jgi:hypothetical protein
MSSSLCRLIVIVATTTMILIIVLESISEMWAILDYLATDFTISSTQQNTIIAVSPTPSSQTLQSLCNRLHDIAYTGMLSSKHYMRKRSTPIEIALYSHCNRLWQPALIALS